MKQYKKIKTLKIKMYKIFDKILKLRAPGVSQAWN